MNNGGRPQFAVIPGNVISGILHNRHREIIDLVEKTYCQFVDGKAINPPSCFLRFPSAPENRIIALPAAIVDGANLAGLKWIASFPGNIRHGLPRASAVLILNDLTTGCPYACLEGSIISATRTAASAVLGAYWLHGQNRSVTSLGVIGAGPIATRIVEYLFHTGWEIKAIKIFDLQSRSAMRLNRFVELQGCARSTLCASCQEAICDSDLVVFATTAAAPYLHDPELLRHCPSILHISLRDLGTDLIMNSNNIVDDADHCLQANTSLHLAEQMCGNRSFVTGNLVELMTSKCKLQPVRPSVFSPFGMGILDLAVGNYVYEIALKEGLLIAVNDFTPSDCLQ